LPDRIAACLVGSDKLVTLSVNKIEATDTPFTTLAGYMMMGTEQPVWDFSLEQGNSLHIAQTSGGTVLSKMVAFEFFD
jgi:hypothetical protein